MRHAQRFKFVMKPSRNISHLLKRHIGHGVEINDRARSQDVSIKLCFPQARKDVGSDEH
jgi:hypothetical protein